MEGPLVIDIKFQAYPHITTRRLVVHVSRLRAVYVAPLNGLARLRFLGFRVYLVGILSSSS